MGMFEATPEIDPYLVPGERVLWQGRSRRRMGSTARWTLYIVAAGAALIFVLTLIGTFAGRGNLSTLSLMPPLLIFIIGLAVVIPLGANPGRSTQARYWVTSQSALIVYPATAWSGGRVTVIALKSTPQLTLVENRDGTGTLFFGVPPGSSYGRYANNWAVDTVPAFWNIDQPREVYHLMRAQLADR